MRSAGERRYGRGSREIAERTAWVHRVAPIWAISPAAWTAVPMIANGSGTRRPASGGVAVATGGETVSTGAAVAAVAATWRLGAERGLAAERADDPAFAVRLAPGLAAAFDDDAFDEDDEALALAVREAVPRFAPVEPDAFEREPALFAAGALEPELAPAVARPRERVGVSAAADPVPRERERERAGGSAAAAASGVAAAAASGAAGVDAAPPDAGVARLALRRVGRLRGRLFRTSRSPFFGEPSVGGMARLLPIRSRGA